MVSPVLSGLAGLVASIASVVLLYPLDQAGVLSQATGEHGGLLYFLLLDDAFRGLTSQLQATGFSYFVYFGAYTAFKGRLHAPWLPQSLADLLAAGLAGVLGVLLSNPLWVATTRLKIGKATGTGLWQELGYIMADEGAGALWNGVFSSLLLVANPAIQFVIYDMLKRNLFRLPQPKALEAFLAGALAKSCATFVTYPAQVIQTRQRVYRHVQGMDDMSLVDCLMDVVVAHGFLALYAGIEAKLLQTVLNSALMFMFYEKLLAVLASVHVQLVSAFRLRRLKRASSRTYAN
ncbi:unnamed protein product [Effrenium voratum]|uniref:Peroxisomal membrane protein PMP34 n=1 Tax=Effrenium voratum TaxID=2562239 RepID=A0AA36NBA0_9DINO|nr:unnamed protein product [Effrenium voratum]CAJ1405980.1 unnamed protein product [Effrenium voratum]